jgi:hypothetical protein
MKKFLKRIMKNTGIIWLIKMCLFQRQLIMFTFKKNRHKRAVKGRTKYFCIGRNKTGTTSIGKAFSDLDFVSPTSLVTGVTRIAGTPNIVLSDVVIGPKSAEFTIGSIFLSNGGSLGISVRFDTRPVPEPASALLAIMGASAVITSARRRRR